VKRVQPYLGGGSTAVIIGAGGLGSHAVQLAKLLTGARIIAVDINDQKLLRAREAGADEAVLGGEGAGKRLRDVTGEAGAQAVMDFVGTDESLALAADVVGRRGIVALLGLAGGSVPFNFYRLAPEASLTTVYAGTVADLQEVVALARRGDITSRVVTYPLAQVNAALDDLRAGKVDGRAVVTP
jgi:propanol-preferring alcohol dehydrogenase